MAVGLVLLAGVAAALQLAIAAYVLAVRPRGPFRVVAGLLLLFNGLAAGVDAVRAGAPWLVGRLLSNTMILADGPTNPLLLSSGLVLLRFTRRNEWDTYSRAAVGLGLAGAVAVLATGVAAMMGSWPYPAWMYDGLMTAPALIGLGLHGIGLSRAMRRRDGPPRDAALLLMAYGSVMVAQAAYFGSQLRTMPIMDALQQGNLWIRWPATVALLAMAAVSLALLCLPPMLNWAWRGRTLMVLAGAALLSIPAILTTASVTVDALTVTLTSNLPLYLLRPLCVGIVLVPRRIAWLLYDVAAAAAVVLLAKLATVVLLGNRFDGFGPADLVGAGLALALLPGAWLLPRRLAARSRKPAVGATTSADERLAAYLLDLYQHPTGPRPADKPGIEAATGITENNVAAAVRRLERRLDANAAPGTFVEERVVGVRGRKRYLLTGTGAVRLKTAAPPNAVAAKSGI